MASVNKAILIGNLGKDPDLRYTPSGQAVATFSLATNERYKDKDGQLVDRTEWHNIVVWGKQAETAKEYLKKGRQIFVDGRIAYRTYDDREGNKRYITEVVAQRIQFLGRREEVPETVPAEPEMDAPTSEEKAHQGPPGRPFRPSLPHCAEPVEVPELRRRDHTAPCLQGVRLLQRPPGVRARRASPGEGGGSPRLPPRADRHPADRNQDGA